MKCGQTIALLALFGAGHLHGGVIGTSFGTAAPPATLGGFSMTPFAADGRVLGSIVSTVPSPLGGDLAFSPSVNLRQVGVNWATWSHGYTGNVYWTDGALSVSFTLPASTAAFYLYAEPNSFAVQTITATTNDGTEVVQSASGRAGATGYGFYATGGDSILSITVASSAGDFALGEFGISDAVVPEPATYATLAGLGMLAFAGLRRMRRS